MFKLQIRIFRYNIKIRLYVLRIVLLLYQPQNGYCYNSDTHFLYAFICVNLSNFKNNKGDILDIGSGSGILGLLLARDFDKLNLYQCEIQKSFAFFSQKNAQINKIKSFLYEGSFLSMDFDKSFDICVSNPPFYHQNVIKSENENKKIARYNDSMPLEEFCEKVAKILKPSGKLFFCYDVKQIDDIFLYLKKYKLNVEALQFVHPKKDKEASLVLVYARKNSKSLLKVFPPLIVFENGDFTQKVNEIYKKSATHSIKVDIEQFD